MVIMFIQQNKHNSLEKRWESPIVVEVMDMPIIPSLVVSLVMFAMISHL